MTDAKEAIENNQQQEFAIQRIYIKDLSFESPNAPVIFKTEWQPEVVMDMQTEFTELGEDNYDVTLTVTANVKRQDKTIFLIELKQSGIFAVKGFEGEHFDHLMGSFCPSVLFPYAREAVSEVSVRGGFPPLYLAPVNFDAFYAEKQKGQAA